MIVSFRSKALERFWTRGESRRVDSRHVPKLQLILGLLDSSDRPEGMNSPGLGFHALTGDMAGRFAVRVDKNWRVTFAWSEQGPDAIDVDYEDYH